MADRKLVDEWRGDDASSRASIGLRRRAARGLHLQQIEESEDEFIYTGIGTELQAERQRRQFTISDVSSTLRIQQAHLSALEEGRSDDLPGPTYAIGFLRTYSEFLDLDGDEIIRQYKSEGTHKPGERRLVFPEPVEEARRPGLTLALISLVVAGSVYGGWIFLERRDLLPVEVVAELPQILTPYLAPAEAPVAAPKAAPTPIARMTEVRDGAVAPQQTEVGDEAVDAASGPATEVAVIQATIDDGSPASIAANASPAPDNAIQPAIPQVQDKLVQGEGERAAAADVSGLANLTDGPVLSASEDSSRAAPAREPAAPIIEAQDGSAPRPVFEATPENMAAETETVVIRRSIVPDVSPISVRREGSDVDTAPAMPAIQAAIAPPPPPAAPAAPARPLAEGGSEAALNSDEGRASLATATASLGYRPQAYGASNRDVRVVLRARAESWVQVQGANNELLLTRMLRAGDSYHAPNRTDLVLMTGNAGAIEILVDGEALGTLGPLGQVRRNIKLDAEHLRDQMHASTSNQ